MQSLTHQERTMDFQVTTASGDKLTANQLATFAHYIQGEQFRFVVTELPGTLPVVTHRASGKMVCRIELTTLGACRNDALQAAKLSLARLIETKGEARVRSVLRAAEVA